MKNLIFIHILLFLTLNSVFVYSQNQQSIDSLNYLLKKAKADTIVIDLLSELSDEYALFDIDEAEKHIDRALKSAEKLNDTERVLKCIISKSDILEKKGNYSDALNYLENGLILGKNTSNKSIISLLYQRIGWLYELKGDYLKALDCFKEELNIEKELNNKEGISNVLNYIGIIYEEMGQYEKAIEYFRNSLKIAEEINDKSGISAALNNIGLIYDYQGDNANALKYYRESLDIETEIGNREGISNGTINIGTVHQKLGDYTKAIECFNKSLNISKEIGDDYGVAICFNNIGEVHELQGNYEKALEYFEKSLTLDKERGDKDDIAISLMNIGNVNMHLNNDAIALEYLEKALKISEEIGDQSNIANSLSCIGSIYIKQKQYDLALQQYKKVLKLHTELGEEDKIADDYIKIGEIYFNLKKYFEAENNALKGLQLAQKFGIKEDIKTASEILAKTYAKQKDFEKAYESHVLFKETYDSLFTRESRNKLNAIESRFELEKKELEIEKQIEKIEQQRTQQKILIGGFLAVLIAVMIAIIALIRIKKAKRIIDEQQKEILESNEELKQINEELKTTIEIINSQKEEIEDQKDKIQKTNDEITASIRYAKYIQNAILPHIEKRKRLLNEHFVFFKPKNIVSGDFYWTTEIEGRTIIAAADCTGHGVPGAFMSMLGVSFLNDIVNKEYITHPGVILRRLRKEVINALQQEGKVGEQRDGMDIALCSIDYNNLEVQFAGANNPLYIVRSKDKKPVENSTITKSENNFLYEIKGDRMPIALDEKMTRFTTIDIKLYKGDYLYMASDGFPDQFGKDTGKKFMYKQLKELLLKNCNLEMSKQHDMLGKTLNSWQGNSEQIDDILVVGVKI